MDNLQRIFKGKLAESKINSQVPIACNILNLYENHHNLLALSQQRRETVEQKNKRIAFQNLHYRDSLNKNLTLLQKKHDKNHKEVLNKIVKTEERKRKNRHQIYEKHEDKEKNDLRDRIKEFRERNDEMQHFWTERKLKSEKSYRIQSSVKPVYQDAVSKKKYIENCQSQKGMQVKTKLLKKHEGRFGLVHQIYENKKQQILVPHSEVISKTLEKNQDLMQERQKSVINTIALHFDQSKDVLKSNKKKLQKKLKDKIIDDRNQAQTTSSNFIERFKQKSANYESCACKRINNVEEGLTKSIALQQKNRSSLFTDTLSRFKKNDSFVVSQRKQFMTRSASMKLSVLSNKDYLQQKKQKEDTERLLRQREIADGLKLKKFLQMQSNCNVRKMNVK